MQHNNECARLIITFIEEQYGRQCECGRVYDGHSLNLHVSGRTNTPHILCFCVEQLHPTKKATALQILA